MHIAIPGSQVIWYDSVTKYGDLLWQNELNDLNRYAILSASGGIMLLWTFALIECILYKHECFVDNNASYISFSGVLWIHRNVKWLCWVNCYCSSSNRHRIFVWPISCCFLLQRVLQCLRWHLFELHLDYRSTSQLSYLQWQQTEWCFCWHRCLWSRNDRRWWL